MPKLRPLEDVTSELRASGYAVSADKLQRLRDFGVRSKRVGRRYYMSDETIQRLSYLLYVEKTFGLARNHNALALELAYRSYPVIPWKRAHTGAQNEVRHFINTIDRAFQRITGKRKSLPTEKHVIKLSRQIARLFIPNTRLDEKQRSGPDRELIKRNLTVKELSSGLSRELLERVLEIVLRAAYLDQDARQCDIEGILTDNGLTDEAALNIATQLAPLFNKLRSTLRMKDNEFFRAILKPTSITTIKATVSAMRSLRTFAKILNRSLTISSDPTVEDYPSFVNPETPNGRLTATGHAFFYASTRWVINHEDGSVNLARLATGELQMTELLKNLSFLTWAIPQAIGEQYEP